MTDQKRRNDEAERLRGLPHDADVGEDDEDDGMVLNLFFEDELTGNDAAGKDPAKSRAAKDGMP
jgi:hypothetical protein